MTVGTARIAVSGDPQAGSTPSDIDSRGPMRRKASWLLKATATQRQGRTASARAPPGSGEPSALGSAFASLAMRPPRRCPLVAMPTRCNGQPPDSDSSSTPVGSTNSGGPPKISDMMGPRSAALPDVGSRSPGRRRSPRSGKRGAGRPGSGDGPASLSCPARPNRVFRSLHLPAQSRHGIRPTGLGAGPGRNAPPQGGAGGGAGPADARSLEASPGRPLGHFDADNSVIRRRPLGHSTGEPALNRREAMHSVVL